jgi:NTE family protein
MGAGCEMATPSGDKRMINLGLQGGGTHGAFTWGVLDRLLEDERIVLEGISGTSAGALNGAVAAEGFRRGGAAGAREALDRFWYKTAEMSQTGLFHRTWMERLQGTWNIDNSPVVVWLEHMNLLISPYQTNPENRSELRTLLQETLDMPALRRGEGIKLFVAATNVRTGRLRVFSGEDLSVDALMASVCMPQVYQSVIIDGDPFWDGGYSGNPTITPLVEQCASPDVVIVQVNPLVREGIPKTAAEIVSRLTEISFNTALLTQLRAIRYVMHLVNEQGASGPTVERLRQGGLFLHRIEAEQEMRALGWASQLNADVDFLVYLKDLGRRTTERWLHENFAALNHRSTFDLDTFLA